MDIIDSHLVNGRFICECRRKSDIGLQKIKSKADTSKH